MTVKEPTDEEIMEALEDMGEPCTCTYLQGTALFGSPEMIGDSKKRCPIHGTRKPNWSTVGFSGGFINAS